MSRIDPKWPEADIEARSVSVVLYGRYRGKKPPFGSLTSSDQGRFQPILGHLGA